jgi:hypothetical protein
MTAINQKIRRLPGFRFEAQTPSRENVLPRMDVALFVGFAASGPVGIPVALESAEHFERIFGKDLPLIWDKEKSETVYAYLPPTVRSFFRNGGKRCWVIRAARVRPTKENPLNRAAYNFFPLSGLAAVNFDNQQISEIVPAFARARSKGSWSDDLQIGAATLSRAVKFISLINSGEQKIVTLEVSANEPIKTGELLRLKFSDDKLVLLMTAEEIEDGAKKQSPPITPPVGKIILEIASKHFVWLEDLPLNPSPAPVENVSVKLWTHQNNLISEDISPTEFFTIRQAELEIPPKNNEERTPKVILKFKDLPSAESPPAGSLIVTELPHKSLCLQVETVNVNDSDGQESVEVICRAVYCPKNVIQPNSSGTVERLTFELWLKKDEQSFIKLSDLAFNAEHGRFWGNLPTDERLLRLSEEKSAEFPEIYDWTQSGAAAAFPMAGNGKRDAFYFPLFPTAFPENYLGAVITPGTKLQRDGLEVFDENLFLDEKLKNTGLNNLLNEAEFIRYLSPRPRPLRGIHSALAPETVIRIAPEGQPTNPHYTSLSLEEATIIAVPDALHRGWQKKNDEEISSPPISTLSSQPEWRTFQENRQPEIKTVSQSQSGNFSDCEISVLEIPEDFRVKGEKLSSEKFTLEWKYADANESLHFVLEESATPNFQFAREIYREKQKKITIYGRGAGLYYYRVRANLGHQFSDWSNGLAVRVPAAENWVVNSAGNYKSGVLFAVQRALLRMCAARGDLFAVLDLPEHYEKDSAINHAATLKITKGLTAEKVDVEPFSADEARTALSFGAVYHPWLMTREDGFAAVRNIPASGAICGVLARRAARRGAWVAPANEVLQGVLGLAKTFHRENYLDFQDGLINLVRHEPTGLTVLGSATLSSEPDLRSINVRRLLSLIRRLALKHGAEYVFEPNDEHFRRLVQRGFSSLLDFMFARGAFAGTTPAASYQVSVSEFLNNPQSIEQGRFIVELRVAPSLPLKFVNVRLVQADGRGSVTEVF